MSKTFCLTTFVFLAALSPSLCAQWQYKRLDVKIDPKVEKFAEDFNRGIVRDVAEGPKAIEEVCRAYVARLTEPYDQNSPNFVAIRRRIDTLLAEGIPRQPTEARLALVSNLVRMAGVIAESKDYSPAARVNCVSILGELDDVRDTRDNSRKPSAAAREKLLQLLDAQTTPSYLKAVVLQGLERHARSPKNAWDDAIKAKVAQAAAVYATMKPASDSDRELNAWLTRRGLDVLRAVRSNNAIDASIGFLGDADELPSLRLSALQYLIQQDLTALTPDQKKQYVLGLAHLLKSQLVGWYFAENDRQRRTSGSFASGSGTGGFGGSGPPSSGSGGLGGLGGGGFGGLGEGEGASGRTGGERPKPIDTQTWETRRARRQLNHVTQLIRFALEGKRIDDERVRTQSFLAAPDLGLATEYDLPRMIELVDSFQTKINDPERITTIQSLMTQTRREIEAIMRYTNQLPGFLEEYSGVSDSTDELDEVAEGDDGGDTSSEDAGEPPPEDPGS